MMNRILQELRKEMECPICLQHMTPPITLCCNGHSICSACKPGLRNCSICRGNLTNNRTIALETIAGKMTPTIISKVPVPASSAEPGESVMDFLVEKYLKQLKCRKCKEYMVPPIMTCKLCVAFVCSYCNPDNPHKCRNGQQMTFIRNGAAEALSRSITHMCRFYKLGCMDFFHADAKKEHEVDCWFKEVSCPFIIAHPCDWKGILHDVKEHIKSSHLYHVLSGTSMIENTCKVREIFFQVVYAMDNFFIHFSNFCSTSSNYKTCNVICLFIGNENEAKGFSYTVRPFFKNEPSTLTKFQCESYCKININQFSISNSAFIHYRSSKYELNILKN